MQALPSSEKECLLIPRREFFAFAVLLGAAFTAVLLLAPVVAFSAPSKQDKEEVSKIVERSGHNLGGLIECGRYDARDEYVASLKDALSVYPGVDLIKMRAFIRQIEQQGEAIGKMGITGIPSPTAEDLERQKRICEWQVSDAQRDMRKLNSFILK